MRQFSILVCVALAAGPALAQTSASYRLDESTVNAGGAPADGQAVTSASYRVTLAAIGWIRIVGLNKRPRERRSETVGDADRCETDLIGALELEHLEFAAYEDRPDVEAHPDAPHHVGAGVVEARRVA